MPYLVKMTMIVSIFQCFDSGQVDADQVKFKHKHSTRALLHLRGGQAAADESVLKHVARGQYTT